MTNKPRPTVSSGTLSAALSIHLCLCLFVSQSVCLSFYLVHMNRPFVGKHVFGLFVITFLAGLLVRRFSDNIGLYSL